MVFESVQMEKTMLYRTTFLLVTLLSCNIGMKAQTVSVADFGAVPSSRKSAVHQVKQALEACRQYESAVLVFPGGRYDFWYDGTLPDTVSQTAINLNGFKNLTIDGGGSEFVFHGRMAAMNVENSENITLRNFSIDWDRPLTSQAVVREVTGEYLEIGVDKSVYPCIIENGRLRFVGEGWKSPVVHYLLFDRDEKEVVPMTRDSPLGDIFEQEAREVAPGVVRLYGQRPFTPDVGTHIALYAQRELHGIRLFRNRNTRLENINVYYATGSGIYSFMCDGLHFNRVNVQVNESKGRVFSSMADATYFPNCKGLVRIENCIHSGQADDWANFRGTYTKVERVSAPRTIHISGKWGRPDNYYQPGDEVCFVHAASMQRGKERLLIEEVNAVNERETRLTFAGKIPAFVDSGYVVENMTWNPEVEVVNCVIPRRNRARGILLTTTERALFENNLFQTAGAAILVEGDTDVWYEAGAVRNFIIRNNVFENCLSSAEPGTWNWGEAVICITPSHHPGSNSEEPYHQNIRIENNVFRHYDYNLLYARSVRGLVFKDNRIEYTDAYRPHGRQVNFYLDGCREVRIENNLYDADYPPRKAELHHMRRKDLRIGKTEQISVAMASE